MFLKKKNNNNMLSVNQYVKAWSIFFGIKYYTVL